MPFNPDKWMTSLIESLFSYINDNIDSVYEIVPEWPDADDLAKKMPLPKTLIHFEVDEPRAIFLGFGDNVMEYVHDDDQEVVEEWEAHCHEVRINVGVWASMESGGASARLEARQDLDRLFNGPAARENLMAHSNGIEVLSFSGGQHLTDSINDMSVFRAVDIELRVRVFSRTKKTPIPFITGIDQSPGLEIDDVVIIG